MITSWTLCNLYMECARQQSYILCTASTTTVQCTRHSYSAVLSRLRQPCSWTWVFLTFNCAPDPDLDANGIKPIQRYHLPLWLFRWTNSIPAERDCYRWVILLHLKNLFKCWKFCECEILKSNWTFSVFSDGLFSSKLFISDWKDIMKTSFHMEFSTHFKLLFMINLELLL